MKTLLVLALAIVTIAIGAYNVGLGMLWCIALLTGIAVLVGKK